MAVPMRRWLRVERASCEWDCMVMLGVAEEVREIALASDGAVASAAGQCGPASVTQMLSRITDLKAQDPRCLQRFDYWRGFLDGAAYLDDTTMLRFRLGS